MNSPFYTHEPISELDGIKKYTAYNYYWGINKREDIQRFIKEARSLGFTDAESLYWTNDKNKTYTNQWDRASFHFFLPISYDAVVLDLGSGYGNNTIPLAKYYGRVVAADATLELLQYTALRAASEGLTNVDFVNIDPLEFCNLPFKPHSFDAIIVSGLLEWVGSALPDVSPATLQQRVLTHLRTLLKSDGVLYIGIENRWFPGYVRRDPHTKLPYTCVLPRFLANIYAKRHGLPLGYKTYVHSSRTYTKMLKVAGFGEIAYAFPHPNYRNPSSIYTNDSEIDGYLYSENNLDRLYTHRWTTFLRIMRPLRLHHFFLSSFIFIASAERGSTIPSLIRRAVEQGIQGVELSDKMMRIPELKNPKEMARFALFHQGQAKPYGYLYAKHNPVNSDDVRLNFTDSTTL